MTRRAVGPIQIQPKAESRSRVMTTSGSVEVFHATSHIAHQALHRLRNAAERFDRLAESHTGEQQEPYVGVHRRDPHRGCPRWRSVVGEANLIGLRAKRDLR
jgi:hypothetical protein